jgi:hypothetical protein
LKISAGVSLSFMPRLGSWRARYTNVALMPLSGSSLPKQR